MRIEVLKREKIEQMLQGETRKSYRFDFYGIKIGWLHIGFIIGKRRTS